LPTYDEFARQIDVVFDRPVRGWQTALDVAVPAHVVGQLAFDIDDAMEAKQAVIAAIYDRAPKGLRAIAEVWNYGFGVGSGTPSEELLVSSGPYQIASIEGAGSETQRITFEVNRQYQGSPTPSFEHVELIAASDVEQLAEFGDRLDVIHVRPTEENWEQIRDLERLDHSVSTANDGTAWAVVTRTDRGVFAERRARVVFLRAIPQNDVREAGAGAWREAHSTTNSLLFASTSRDYGIAVEDSGFRETFPRQSGGDADEARERAGVERGTQICVLYDNNVPFAVAAFEQLRESVAEAGWRARDCGTDNLSAALENNDRWDAVLMNVPVPETPTEVAELWGGEAGLTGKAFEERDQLIEELAATADRYEARDLKVAIDATLMREGVALPLAMNPVVTIADREIDNVRRPSGRHATLLSRVVDWRPGD
jgi:peptide/nickel transport system substrate-binding protein